MRIVFISAAIVLFLAAGSFASEVEKKEEIGVMFSSEISSRYVYINGSKSTNAAVQDTFNVLLPGGLYVDIWSLRPILEEKGKETDFTVGWGNPVGPVKLEAGLTYGDVNSLMKINRGDFWKIFAVIKKDFTVGSHTLSPFVRGDVFLPVKGGSKNEKGELFSVGAEMVSPLFNKVSARQRIGVLYDNGALGLEKTGIFSYAAKLDWKVFRHISFFAGADFYVPLTKVSDGRKNEAMFSSGIRFDF